MKAGVCKSAARCVSSRTPVIDFAEPKIAEAGGIDLELADSMVSLACDLAQSPRNGSYSGSLLQEFSQTELLVESTIAKGGFTDGG